MEICQGLPKGSGGASCEDAAADEAVAVVDATVDGAVDDAPGAAGLQPERASETVASTLSIRVNRFFLRVIIFILPCFFISFNKLLYSLFLEYTRVKSS